ncbi:hypothetical protein JAAARDRAFT_611956 [Jaapia argillacea MUCL 33604]|uniref:Uncharacterized protein n=1 Tax=Jaapia argillacea MUCL 33604 TaxID=933084 RepID=A0A067P512_9AGAM|nr:hypothetical protein JAAARDRAFT_611956 [Jaapia argillacea MUCL 33604]
MRLLSLVPLVRLVAAFTSFIITDGLYRRLAAPWPVWKACWKVFWVASLEVSRLKSRGSTLRSLGSIQPLSSLYLIKVILWDGIKCVVFAVIYNENEV